MDTAIAYVRMATPQMHVIPKMQREAAARGALIVTTAPEDEATSLASLEGMVTPTLISSLLFRLKLSKELAKEQAAEEAATPKPKKK